MIVQDAHRLTHAQPLGLVQIASQGQGSRSQLNGGRSSRPAALQRMSRVNFTLAVLAPAFFSNQFGHTGAHFGYLLDVLSQRTFLADRPLTVRTAGQVYPDMFVHLLGPGP